MDDLLAELGHNRGEWSAENRDRKTLAETLGMESAIFKARTKGAKTLTRDVRRLSRALESIRPMPAEREYLHIITGAEFAGFDLLPAMLQATHAKCFRRLTLTTLGFSRPNLESLTGLLEAKQVNAKTLRILCSDFFRRSDRDIWRDGATHALKWGYGFRSTRNHTKLILAEIGHAAYVVESSANLRSCSNFEQFTVTRNRPLFNFHCRWIEKVWETAEN